MEAISLFKVQLVNDGNLGLAKTVHKRVMQAKVKKLAEVFITLGFDEIRDKASLKDIDVQHFLAQMIYRGHLSAKIDAETRTVQFVEEVDLLSLVNSIDLKNRRIV
jgi:PCI domain